MSSGFKNQSTQETYAKYKIYPEDMRSIAQVLQLGKELFHGSAVKQIIEFAQQAKANNLTLKRSIVQYRQFQSGSANKTTCKLP